jgi:hypothetical protein
VQPEEEIINQELFMKQLGALRYFVFVFISTLVGCGGGGGGSSSSSATTPTVSTSAEGVYSGTISNGNSFDGIILENGAYYILYGQRSAGTMFVYGFVQGVGASNNGSFASSNLKDFYANGTIISGAVSASYGTNNTFSGVVSEGGASLTFSGTPPTSTTYVYNSSANLADISGAWTLTDMLGGALSMSVAANGTFSGSWTSGCVFTGALTPRSSGKNIFDMSITLGASPCSTPNQTSTGIAIDYLLANGKRQLIVGGVNSARSLGTSVFGTR